MTDQELKELVASLASAQTRTDLQIKETERQLRAASRETNAQLKELGRQIGGLGRKFGSFTEGMALPAMEKILRRRFGMEVISPRVRARREGRELEIDVLAYADGAVMQAYVVEVKSHAREEAVEQLRQTLEDFRRFFPEHADKRAFGVLAAVDFAARSRERALDAGFYVARIRDDSFELDVPANFRPQAY